MPNCKKYQQLTPFEKSIFIGQLIHAVQSDDELFEQGQCIINYAAWEGHYNNVKFHPEEVEYEEVKSD